MNRNLKLVSILLVALFVVGSMLPVQAGTKGRLIVKITDGNTGDPLSDVAIKLVSEKSAARIYDMETNKKGKAMISGLDPDNYTYTAVKEGYLTLKGSVKLRIGFKTEADWKMLTIEDAKEKQIAGALEKMTEEERNQYQAMDEHNKGMDAYEKDDIPVAKASFLKAIELWPDISYLEYLLLGQFAWNDKDVDGAILYLDKALELLESDLVKAGELEKVLETAEPGTEETLKLEEEASGYDIEGLKASRVDIYRLLGASYMIKEDYPKVKEIWGVLVAEAPDQNILFNLANIGIKEKNYKYAIQNLDICCKSFPDYADAQMLLGDLYIQENDYSNALKAYKNYLAILEKSENVSPETLKNAKDTVKLLKEMQKKK